MNLLELFEYAFRRWLEEYMTGAEYWYRLSLHDRDILIDACWQDFVKTWQEVYSSNKKLGT